MPVQRRMMLVGAVLAGLFPALVPAGAARAVGTVAASVSVADARYNGSGGCIEVPLTLNVNGGVSNGFAYWTTENETLAGPTSWPSAPGLDFDNEQAPGIDTIQMCPLFDHAGVYTYSADVWFHNWTDEGGDQYAGRVSATFTLGAATTTIRKIARHTWQVSVVGQPYLIATPHVKLQKKASGRWKTVAKGSGNSAGKFALKKRAAGRYRLVYLGDGDRGVLGCTSRVFRKP